MHIQIVQAGSRSNVWNVAWDKDILLWSLYISKDLFVCAATRPQHHLKPQPQQQHPFPINNVRQRWRFLWRTPRASRCRRWKTKEEATQINWEAQTWVKIFSFRVEARAHMASYSVPIHHLQAMVTSLKMTLSTHILWRGSTKMRRIGFGELYCHCQRCGATDKKKKL